MLGSVINYLALCRVTLKKFLQRLPFIHAYNLVGPLQLAYQNALICSAMNWVGYVHTCMMVRPLTS